MKIIIYEMRKSWLKISAVILLIILSILDMICLSDMCKRNNDRVYGELGQSYYRAYNKFCGEITEEKISLLKKESDELAAEVADGLYSTEYDPNRYTGYIFGDNVLLNNEIKPKMSYCILYPNTSNKIALTAYENIDFYKSLGCDFEARKNEKIAEMYKDRYIPEYRTTVWTDTFFNYDFSSLLCIIMLIFGLSASISTEHETAMIQLIISTGKGRKTTVSKIISAAIYCAILSLYFVVIDIMGINAFLGIDGMNMPIYSAQIFEKTPYNFSFITAIILYAGLRFLSLFLVSLIIMLFSQIFKNSILSISFSFASVIALIVLSTMDRSIFNPVNLFISRTYLEKFEVLNFFNYPVLSLTAASLMIFIMSILSIVMIIFVGRIRGEYFHD